MTTPTQAQKLADERERFEAWYCEDAERQGILLPDGIAHLREDDHYGAHRSMLNGKWEGWQARASLSTSPKERA